jgi:hypothetical protein
MKGNAGFFGDTSAAMSYIRPLAVALKSPRFAPVPRLQRASVNNPPLSYGETGQPVRVLQKALIDLGFPLPKSTRKFNSPDGIFGDETVAGFKAFQIKNRLLADGIVGTKTMARLDELLPTAGDPLPPLPPGGAFTHRLRIHMRSISMPTVGEMTQLFEMQRVYAQFGIEVVMASGMSLGLSDRDQITLTNVDGDCTWDTVSEDQQLLQDLARDGISSNEIAVYFATILKEKNGDTLQGCASHRPGKPACMVASTAIDKTTMAHEVGHVLLTSSFSPVHTGDSNNLMCAAPICTGNPATLTPEQIAKITSSPFLVKL